ncbi:MAG: EAL domain-containing protein [Bacillota bacterium]|nr:EAL domain-containing protein [Bacillota bacterium]
MSEENRFQEINTIKEIVENNNIVAQYQPIVSLSKQKVVGFEGLSRGLNKLNSKMISPIKMFEYACNNGLAVNFDRGCRDKCLEGFKCYHCTNKDLRLFVNIEASIIEEVHGSNYFLQQVLKYGFSPENIVIEINESNVKHIDHLVAFVKQYRGYGFLIALDDVGTGFSNFERISLLKPDIIKLDRSLIKDIEDSYHKQEILRSLVNLANKIGAVVIVEGVETEVELDYALEYGAHLIQGYYFSKPLFLNNELMNTLDDKIKNTAVEYKDYIHLKMKKEQIYRNKIDRHLKELISDLEYKKSDEFDRVLQEFVYEHTDLNIECSYILDLDGIQISNTIFARGFSNKRDQSLMFYPAEKGSDNSLKKYYYELVSSRLNKYITDPYISHATGNVCRTISIIFNNALNTDTEYILCVDFTLKQNS